MNEQQSYLITEYGVCFCLHNGGLTVPIKKEVEQFCVQGQCEHCPIKKTK
jgi:hypothetical protein